MKYADIQKVASDIAVSYIAKGYSILPVNASWSGHSAIIFLRKGTDRQHVLCVSENKDFDPFEIEIGDILRLYLVKGSVQKNTL